MSAPTKRLPFQIRWQKALMKSELDTTAKIVGCAIVAHADRYGRGARPAKVTLARYCSLRLRTVDEAVNRLEDAGWISVERSHGQKPNRYECHLHPAPRRGVQRARIRVPNPAPSASVEQDGKEASNPAPNDTPTPRQVPYEVNPEDKVKNKTFRYGRTRTRRPLIGDDDYPAFIAAALSPPRRPFESDPEPLITVGEAERAYAAHVLVCSHRQQFEGAA